MDKISRTENTKYKLLGFENDKQLALIMILSTGKILKITLSSLLKSEIIDNLNKNEIKSIFRKYYSHDTALTVYEVNDRHEEAWMVFVALNLILLTLYVFTNFSAGKIFYLEQFDIIIPPGVFLYPLTFLVVDLLNEFYGLKLARKAILFSLISNAFIFTLLIAASYLPGLPSWKLDSSYTEIINHLSSVLVASSVSFLVSEYANSYLLCKIKELTNSKFLFLRVFLSTFFAVIIDSILFCYIAFYDSLENSEILNMIYVQVAIKICFAVFNILPAYGARALFKRYVNAAG